MNGPVNESTHKRSYLHRTTRHWNHTYKDHSYLTPTVVKGQGDTRMSQCE